jgi:hypothetical protein
VPFFFFFTPPDLLFDDLTLAVSLIVFVATFFFFAGAVDLRPELSLLLSLFLDDCLVTVFLPPSLFVVLDLMLETPSSIGSISLRIRSKLRLDSRSRPPY